MSEQEEQIIVDLLEVMEAAIQAGDWVVDGACDPYSAMDRAEILLTRSNWVRKNDKNETWYKL
jgi:hypothetical protein